MNGRQKVATLRGRMNSAFERGKQLAEADSEIQADHSKYLCVLVSGYLEKSVSELLVEYARNSGAPSFERFVEASTRKFTNANVEKLKETLGRFNPKWRERMDEILVDEYKEAVDAVIALRHTIAHGGDTGVTYRRICDYDKLIQFVVSEIADLCVPIRRR